MSWPRSAASAGLVLVLACVEPAVSPAHERGGGGRLSASAAGTCDVRSSGRSLGATYVTSLRTQRVSCARGRSIVKAFNACRRAAGGAEGRCRTRVSGYKCVEQRGGIATQFSGKVTCRRSKATVRFTYTQFT